MQIHLIDTHPSPSSLMVEMPHLRHTFSIKAIIETIFSTHAFQPPETQR
jgi:hypothetical protein